MLIAQQAITQNFILREVVRRPDLRADLEKSWSRIDELLLSAESSVLSAERSCPRK